MRRDALFEACCNLPYRHVEADGDFAVRYGQNQFGERILYLFFECSNGKADWKNNLDFPAKPYRDMGILWFCHRGFLRVWKAIEPYLLEIVGAEDIRGIVITGYSHGAALAMLAHEYCWFHRPDLRRRLCGFGFGCPRCYFGFFVKPAWRVRWEHFYPIRNAEDLVTHMPPRLFGFVHCHPVIQVGEGSVKSRIDAHRPEYYRARWQELCAPASVQSVFWQQYLPTWRELFEA